MLTRDPDAFVAHAKAVSPDFGPATPRAAFLVSPEGFALADESATDNRYMAAADAFNPARAAVQHRQLQRALSACLPTICFPGDPHTPDALFPNNVFATVAGRSIVGRMRHAIRRREAARADIRGFMRDVLGYREVDLSQQPHPCELTGALLIDRRRGLGWCGLSERCDAQGAALMHAAFGLRATLMFDLSPGEYHTNVICTLLAGRAVLLSEAGFVDSRVLAAFDAIYAPHVIRVTADEQAAFACNAIALSDDTVWMSACADAALTAATRDDLARAGFRVHAVALDAIEAAGGSLRCCVAEIY